MQQQIAVAKNVIETELFSAALFRLRVSTKPMSALEALDAVAAWVNQADSFVQTFGHDDHGDEGGECRFDTDEMDRGMNVLNKLIEAALDADNEIGHPGALDALYSALNGGPA